MFSRLVVKLLRPKSCRPSAPLHSDREPVFLQNIRTTLSLQIWRKRACAPNIYRETLLTIILHDAGLSNDSTHSPDMDSSTERENTPDLVPCPPSVSEKALLRKIDLRVIPVLFILYLAAFLDR